MSENGAKPSVQALDAFAEWMRRVDERLSALDQQTQEARALALGAQDRVSDLQAPGLEKRIEALEADKDRLKPFDVAQRERIDVCEKRLAALEAKLPDNTLNPKHWRAEPDGTFDATVQLRRDVGTLVRAAREVIAEIDRDEGVRAARVSALRAAVNIFAGDYT